MRNDPSLSSAPLLNVCFKAQSDEGAGAAENHHTATSSLLRSTGFMRRHRRTFCVAGHNHTVFDIPPYEQNPRGHVLYVTGCESDPLLFPAQIEQLLDHGLHVTAARQVKRKEHKNHIGKSQNFITWLLSHSDSPIHNDKNRSLPFFIFDHSSTKTMRDNAILNDSGVIRKPTTHIFENAPFSDVSTAYMRFDFEDVSLGEHIKSFVLSNAFDWRARKYPDAIIGEDLILDRIIKRLIGANEDAGAAYVEAVAYRQLGQANLIRLKMLTEVNPDHPILQIPTTVFADPADGAAAFQATEREVKLKPNAELIKTKGGHNPAEADPSVMPKILEIMNPYLLPRQQPAINLDKAFVAA